MRIQEEVLGSLRGGPGSISTPWKRRAVWYSLAVVPLVDAWFNGSEETLIVGLPNRGRIPWLHDDVVIEAAIAIRVPQRLDVLPLPAVPELPRALLSQQAAFETLTTRALLGAATEEGLTRALLANPMVRSVDQARGLVDAIRRSVEAGPG
jgi:alpha-galactosidase/6-phospho-beta-glucosidase family protein